MGLFLGELVSGGAYSWTEFCVSEWVRNTTLKQLTPMVHGLIFGRASYWKDFASVVYQGTCFLEDLSGGAFF